MLQERYMPGHDRMYSEKQTHKKYSQQLLKKKLTNKNYFILILRVTHDSICWVLWSCGMIVLKIFTGSFSDMKAMLSNSFDFHVYSTCNLHHELWT